MKLYLNVILFYINIAHLTSSMLAEKSTKAGREGRGGGGGGKSREGGTGEGGQRPC